MYKRLGCFRRSLSQDFYKKAVLKNSSKFAGAFLSKVKP